jgi:uncharacterized protein (UPF0305 family)
MFNVDIDMNDVIAIREFLESDECEFVQNMNQAGLEFSAMALVIQAINDKLNEVEKELTKED